MGYIDTTNGFNNDSLQVYSSNFWVRAINNGTGNVIIDGNVSVPNMNGPYNEVVNDHLGDLPIAPSW